MKRPPKPGIHPGDRIQVQVCTWKENSAFTREWLPTGETFETTATEVRWDGWAEAWQVHLDVNQHHGRVAAKYVRTLDRTAWTAPDLFESTGAIAA